MRRFFIFLLFIVSVVSHGQVVPTTARMSLSADSVLIGDTLRLNVNIDKDVAQELSVVMFKDNKLSDKIEILGLPTVDTISRTGRHVKLRLGYTLISFDAGDYLIERFPILLGAAVPFDTLFAEGSALLKVGTFEIDTLKQQPEDIKAILNAPFQWAELWQWLGDNWWIPTLGLVVAAMIVGAIWWWRRRRMTQQMIQAALPAHVRALMALEALHNKKLWQDGRVKEYYSMLTDILRQYIEQRYAIGAMEMTSTEIEKALSGENTEKLLSPIRELLYSADLVKFAKWTPDPTASETAYFDVYYYVEQTKIEDKDPLEKEEN